ncbi:MAG: PQQ-binding-like beta-propeller repeat protein [Myxococcota bacterium]|nr:PQQ-binding-like beta-propeller repeat protein [Myxococcales bacterium]
MIPAAALRIDARIPRVAAWLLSTLLLACGGSGGSDGTPLSVGVSKGPVEGATCSLLDDADALVGRAVETDVRGRAVLSIPAKQTGRVTVRCEGGSYLDEATGVRISATAPALRMRSRVEIDARTASSIVVSPFTELAFRMADADGDPDDFEAFLAQVASALGLAGIDLARTIPVDLIGTPLADPASPTDAEAYGVALAGFSQTIHTANADPGQAPGEIDTLLETLRADLADGTLEFANARALRDGLVAIADSTTPGTAGPNVTQAAIASLVSAINAAPDLLDAPAQDLVLGDAVMPLRFENLGGDALTSCLATPALPGGLDLRVSSDGTTCELDGTPSEVIAPTSHSIAATNAVGADQASIVIGVTDLAPVLSLHFPVSTAGAPAQFDGNTIDVTGLVDDPSALPTTVRVQGGGASVDAIVEADGRWRAADVPLVGDAGLATLRIEATNTDGRMRLIETPIDVQPMMVHLAAIALDAPNGRVFAVDPFLRALIEIDLATGIRSVVSNAFRGTGPGFDNPSGLALDAANGRIFVADRGLEEIFELDLATGDRTLLPISAPLPIRPTGLAFDPAGNRLIFSNLFQSTIEEIDLATGSVRTVTSEFTASGPLVRSPWGLALDLDANRVFVACPHTVDRILAVDLTTGIRTAISDDVLGSGPAFVQPRDVILDAPNGRLLVSDDGGTLLSIDVATGDRTPLWTDPRKSPPAWANATAIVWDPTGDRVLLGGGSQTEGGLLDAIDLVGGSWAGLSRSRVGSGVQSGQLTAEIDLDASGERVLFTDTEEVYALDLRTGERTRLSDGDPTTGFTFPSGFALDLASNRAFIGDPSDDAIYVLDLGSGAQSILSDDATGAGTPFGTPTGLALDDGNARLFVGDSLYDGLIAVDLATGDRTLIGAGEARNVVALALDPASQRAIVTAPDRWLRAIDLVTGAGTVLSTATSGAQVGTGPDFGTTTGVALDLDSGLAYVVGTPLESVFAVDLASGDRVIVTSESTGSGTILPEPHSVRLDASHERLILGDRTLDAIVAVDLVSGDRVVLSR